MEPFVVKSCVLPDPRAVWVQRASTIGASQALIILDAGLYLDRVRSAAIIVRLQNEKRVPAVDCVYVSAVDSAARHAELTCNEQFADFLAHELIEWIEDNVSCHEHYALCGLSLSGLQAVYTLLRNPRVFSGAIAQSPSAWWNEEWLTKSLTQFAPASGRYRISVGDQELDEYVVHPPTGLLQNVSQVASCRRLASGLARAGAEVEYVEFEGGHDPACWARELPNALDWLLNGSQFRGG